MIYFFCTEKHIQFINYFMCAFNFIIPNDLWNNFGYYFEEMERLSFDEGG